jgi:hypothetical protein
VWWHVFEGIRHGKQQDVQENLPFLPRCDLAGASQIQRSEPSDSKLYRRRTVSIN